MCMTEGKKLIDDQIKYIPDLSSASRKCCDEDSGYSLKLSYWVLPTRSVVELG